MNQIIQRPRTSRYRPGQAYEEKRTNAWAAFIGFMLGRGYSTPAIAQRLADGTSDATIRHMSKLWGLPSWGKSSDCFVVVPMKQRDRATIAARAGQEGLSQEEWCRRLLVAGSKERATFRAVVGNDEGQFL
jgi:hypothetical protein